jgi:hypothetical protein
MGVGGGLTYFFNAGPGPGDPAEAIALEVELVVRETMAFVVEDVVRLDPADRTGVSG